jgi:hypothetical protein
MQIICPRFNCSSVVISNALMPMKMQDPILKYDAGLDPIPDPTP